MKHFQTLMSKILVKIYNKGCFWLEKMNHHRIKGFLDLEINDSEIILKKISLSKKEILYTSLLEEFNATSFFKIINSLASFPLQILLHPCCLEYKKINLSNIDFLKRQKIIKNFQLSEFSFKHWLHPLNSSYKKEKFYGFTGFCPSPKMEYVLNKISEIKNPISYIGFWPLVASHILYKVYQKVSQQKSFGTEWVIFLFQEMNERWTFVVYKKGIPIASRCIKLEPASIEQEMNHTLKYIKRYGYADKASLSIVSTDQMPLKYFNDWFDVEKIYISNKEISRDHLLKKTQFFKKKNYHLNFGLNPSSFFHQRLAFYLPTYLRSFSVIFGVVLFCFFSIYEFKKIEIKKEMKNLQGRINDYKLCSLSEQETKMAENFLIYQKIKGHNPLISLKHMKNLIGSQRHISEFSWKLNKNIEGQYEYELELLLQYLPMKEFKNHTLQKKLHALLHKKLFSDISKNKMFNFVEYKPDSKSSHSYRLKVIWNP